MSQLTLLTFSGPVSTEFSPLWGHISVEPPHKRTSHVKKKMYFLVITNVAVPSKEQRKSLKFSETFSHKILLTDNIVNINNIWTMWCNTMSPVGGFHLPICSFIWWKTYWFLITSECWQVSSTRRVFDDFPGFIDCSVSVSGESLYFISVFVSQVGRGSTKLWPDKRGRFGSDTDSLQKRIGPWKLADLAKKCNRWKCSIWGNPHTELICKHLKPYLDTWSNIPKPQLISGHMVICTYV